MGRKITIADQDRFGREIDSDILFHLDVDAKVRIEAGTIIDIDIDGGHDDAHDPQIDARLVFQPQVDESHEGADHFQVVHDLIPLDCFTGIGSPGKGCPRLRSGRECRE